MKLLVKTNMFVDVNTMFSLFDDPSPCAKYRFSYKIATKYYTSFINDCTKPYSKRTMYLQKLSCIET